MNSKISKGKGFLGALKYDLEKEGSKFISTNLVSEHSDIREMAREMRSVALQRSVVVR